VSASITITPGPIMTSSAAPASDRFVRVALGGIGAALTPVTVVVLSRTLNPSFKPT
jgi:hypothetical protein